jgi:hypothetical protein
MTEFPYPVTPETVATDVLADAAGAHTQVLATKGQAAAQIAQAPADFAAHQAAEATRLADSRLLATANALASQIDATQALLVDLAAASAELDDHRDAAATGFDALAGSVVSTLVGLAAKRQDTAGGREQAYQQGLALASGSVIAMMGADMDMAAAAGQVTDKGSALASQRLAAWEDFRHVLAAGDWGWRHLPPPPPAAFSWGEIPPDFVPYAWTQYVPFIGPLAAGLQQETFEIWRGLSEAWNIDQTIAVHRAQLKRVTHCVGHGTCDPEEYQKAYRLPPEAVRAIATLAKLNIEFMANAPLLAGPSAAARRGFEAEMRLGARNTLGEFCTRNAVCFTAETLVQRPAQGGDVWYASAGIALVAGALAAVAVSPRVRRQGEGSTDSFFTRYATPSEGESPVGDEARSSRDDGTMEELCDRLFCGHTDDEWWNDGPNAAPGTPRPTDQDGEAAANEPYRLPTCLGVAAADTTTGLEPNGRVRKSRSSRRSRAARRTQSRPAAKPAPAIPNRSSRMRGMFLALAVLALGFLSAGFCTFHGWRASQDTITPIAHLEPGQKVDARLSREAADAAIRDVGPRAATWATRIDPATWKLLILRAECRWDDGTLDDIHVKTLQPPQWLQAHDVRVGGEAPLPLDLVEMGLPENLRAKVLAIRPCPPIQPGPGRIVLTTVNHLNSDVMELTVESADGRRETFRPTGSHKFYRETDDRWVSARELRHGDHLSGTSGPLKLVATRPLPGVHRVHNLTVEGEHVYRVSALNVLAHNNLCREVGQNGAVKNFDVVDYRPTTSPFENHHGILDVWAKHNIDNYVSRGARTPTLALTNAQHEAATRVYRDWLFEQTGKRVGGRVDWSKISPQEMQSLANRMFDAADVPEAARLEYFRAFYQYVYRGS